jgi:multidrug efflux pump
MFLSDTAVKRPVLASVISFLLVAFGLVAFQRLQVREYPDIEPAIVTVETVYPGASAPVIERQITQIIEDAISGVEALRSVESSSSDGVSTVTIEFEIERDIDAAANDIREAVSRVISRLPEEVRPPEVSKQDSTVEVLMWLNLEGDGMRPIELADYAERYLADRFAVLPGVARVRVSGASRYAMRIWIDREALASRDLTVTEVEEALRLQNVEFPAGSVQSLDRSFTVRIARDLMRAEDFAGLVLKRGDDGYLVRLGEVARVEVGPEEPRLTFRGNGVPMVGVGIIPQSRANTLEVARAAKAEMEVINRLLPEGMRMKQSYDVTMFIESSLREVFTTLGIAVCLVILVIYLFLGDWRAMLIPALAVPVSIVATCIVLYLLDFSVNVLTLLAVVLAIGLVVDDAIVVLENMFRRLELGEKRRVAAYRGARQVGFAVIATTLVLISVFLPITFLEGDLGKLFTEFAVTLAAAVAFSSVVALTLSPMLGSKILRAPGRGNFLTRGMDALFRWLQGLYGEILRILLRVPALAPVLVAGILWLAWTLQQGLPDEFTPREDRGSFFIITSAPEGATYGYAEELAREVEERLLPFVENGEAMRLLVRTPRGFGAAVDYHQVVTIMVLNDWSQRRGAQEIMDDARSRLADLRGVTNFVVMRQGLTRGLQRPLQFVLSGSSYEELTEWRDILLEKAAANPKLVGLDYDFKETRPQLRVSIDRVRAADLGVSVANIGRTLETVLGGRRVTTFVDGGEEYDVVVEGLWEDKASPGDLANLYVRSEGTGRQVPLANLVTVQEFADAGSLNRYNRLRSLTLEANLAPGYRLSEALDYMDALAAEHLPEGAIISYKGESLKLRESGESSAFIFVLALLVVYLVLAAQFESFVQPIAIMLTVPVAVLGALVGLELTGSGQSIYSQIGLIMLVGLSAKNGILIVEFINQLRDAGRGFREAILEASQLRLRPILMTGLTTVVGSLPLIFSSGAGAETRFVVGVVILFGVGFSVLFTLVLVPMAYALVAKGGAGPGEQARRLERELEESGEFRA